VDHVVLERRDIAERWRSERWDSLRLLTPNWLTRLPGWRYEGPDPNGFMTMPEVVRFLGDYAKSFSAPVHANTTVQSITSHEGGYRVATDAGVWTARSVVVATGHCDRPLVPAAASRLSTRVHQLTPPEYRRPEDLPEGGVLVVGASASGVQIAEELRRSGREVVLAVGRHVRVPRRYRGRDIMWWLDRAGILSDRVEDLPDSDAARAQPSFQLVGSPNARTIDLGTLQAQGVRLVGRVCDIAGEAVRFAEDLHDSVDAAERKLTRVLARIDRFVVDAGLSAETAPPEAPAPVRVEPAASRLDLRGEGIATVVWATGYGRHYPWLQVPVIDAAGEIAHRGGITAQPGLVVLGLRLLRRRNSSFIDGVGRDAEELSLHLIEHLGNARRLAA
jgi:putative flavoprotein involved in K+ transport